MRYELVPEIGDLVAYKGYVHVVMDVDGEYKIRKQGEHTSKWVSRDNITLIATTEHHDATST